MPHFRSLAGVVCTIAWSLLTACGQTAGTPGATVDRFLGAIRSGDDTTARACMVAAERDDTSTSFQKQGLADGYRIGATTTAGERATVQVEIGQQTMPMALRREQGQWRVSMTDTMQQMLGMSPEAMQKAMEDATRQLGRQMQQGIEKAFRDGLAAPAGR